MDDRTGSKNPRWKEQIVKGSDASTYYRRSSTDYDLDAADVEAWYYDNPAPNPVVSRTIRSTKLWKGDTNVPNKLEDSVLRDQALARVKRRINNLTESYQALIPLAELRELRGLVGSISSMTMDTLNAIGDLKRTKGRSLFSHVSKVWLTYSFGVRPLMSDIKDVSNSIWTYLTSGDKNDRVTGTASKTWLASWNGQSVTGGYLTPIKYVTSARYELSYRFVGGWKFNLRSSTDYNALAHFGITPPALVPALWETTAFSWVVDYFTTVGDFLEDQFVGQAGSPVYVVENRKSLVRQQCFFEHYSSSSKVKITRNKPGTSLVERWDFERTPYIGLPSRSLRWKTMDEMGLHGVTKLLNLAAVVLSHKH